MFPPPIDNIGIAMTKVTESCPTFFGIQRTVTHQAPLSMGFSSKHTGVGCRFLLHGIFLTQGWNLHLLY